MLSRDRAPTSAPAPGPPPPTGVGVPLAVEARAVRFGRRRWRPGLLLGGAALVVGSMLVGLLLFTSGTATTPVLVAAHDLGPGETLTSDDFRVREVALDGSFEAMTLAEQRVFFADGVERTVQGFVPEGSIVSERHFVARSEALAEGQTVVGVQLPPGAYPAGLATGDRVQLYAVGGQDQAEAELLGQAEVRLAQISEQSGDLTADLLIEGLAELPVIQAQAVDRLRLALVRGEG